MWKTAAEAKLPEGPVIVEWVDAAFQDAEQPASTIKGTRTQTIGFLLGIDRSEDGADVFIVLGQDQAPGGGSSRGMYVIPVEIVREILPLSPSRTRRVSLTEKVRSRLVAAETRPAGRRSTS